MRMFWDRKHQDALEKMMRIDRVALTAEVEHDAHAAGLTLCGADDECIEAYRSLFLNMMSAAVRHSERTGCPLTPYLSMKWKELQES